MNILKQEYINMNTLIINHLEDGYKKILLKNLNI